MAPKDEEHITAYLAGLKAEWRSSPEGIYWHRLYVLLAKHGEAPPMPYILSGSASSNASKLVRLGEQLRWAAKHACLDEAFDYLSRVEPAHWSRCLPERWNKHSYS